MFQFALERALFRFKHDGPTCKPLLQLPPAIARKARGRAYMPLYLLFFLLLFIAGHCVPASPAAAYAATGFL